MNRPLIVAGAAAAVVCAHVGAALYFAEHDPYTTEIVGPCPILALTGWQCPACGGIRATASLLRGDVAQSLAMNPLVLAIYLAAALVIGSFAAAARARHRLGKALARAAVVVVVATGLYTGVIRNLVGS